MSVILERYHRFVLWGFNAPSGDSFRHIHRHFAHALTKLNKKYAWLDDTDKNRATLRDGDLVFAVDIASKHLGRALPGVSYVLHNFAPSHPIWDGLDEKNVLRLQVYTSDAERYGVEWEPARRYDREGRILFQPWGTDLLAEEFHAPILNTTSTEVPFVGSIWDDDGMGNIPAIKELKKIVNAHRLVFRHYAHISDDENIGAIRAARLAPAIAGAWQVEQDYLPCRVFKNVSYGALALTNVPKFRELFNGCFAGRGSIAQIFTEAMSLNEKDYLELVSAQQEVVKRYTYRESLISIARALEEGQ